jgi:signal transduction histidine kinase
VTIVRQRRELHERVTELSTLLEHNAELDGRVRGSAARATAINERFLRRLSADLHDGPGQDLGFALMRLDTMANRLQPGSLEPRVPGALQDDYKAIRTGLESALADLRSISAGLMLPEIDDLSVAEVAARAVRDYERKSGAKVMLDASGPAVAVSMPVKITLYRLLQEALANGFRHADAKDQLVRIRIDANALTVEVSDGGPGFDTSEVVVAGRIGLAGMRERIQALGGSFELHTSPGKGTTIEAILPTRVPGDDHE